MDELPDSISQGTVVAWRTWCGTATARVLSADTRGVTLKAADGMTERLADTCYLSLADRLARYRPATSGEAAEFARRERPTDYPSTRD